MTYYAGLDVSMKTTSIAVVSVDVGLQMGTRRTLIDIRTKLKNSIRGFLKAYGIRFGTISHQKFQLQYEMQ